LTEVTKKTDLGEKSKETFEKIKFKIQGGSGKLPGSYFE